VQADMVPDSGKDEGSNPTPLSPRQTEEPKLSSLSKMQTTDDSLRGTDGVHQAYESRRREPMMDNRSHTLPLSRGSRKQFAVHLDSFWSEIFDLHGRSVHAKQRSGLASLDETPLLHAKVLQALRNVTRIPGSDNLRITTCSLESDLRQDEDRINGVLLSLTLLPPEAELSSFLADAQPRGLGLTIESLVFLNFASWCIIRILELCAKEPRPELWGKYCFVLNRLQGSLVECVYDRNHPERNEREIISRCNAVTAMVLASKGPSGTSAGEVAFPKGKEITLSVMNRYIQILSRHQSQSILSQSQDDYLNK